MRQLQRSSKRVSQTLSLVGSEEDVKKNGEGLDLTGIKVVDPATSDRTAAYIDKLVELRSKKGMTPEQAKEILLNQIPVLRRYDGKDAAMQTVWYPAHAILPLIH